MKKLSSWMFLFLSMFAATSFASRLPEIEEYYTEKVSELLKMRFPNTPYTVFVQLDVDDKTKDYTRKKETKRGGLQVVQLPYLEVDDEELTVWDRTDIPLNSLIGLLDKVLIRVQIDSEVTDTDLKDLQDNIAKQLKLDASADSIEIAKVDFSSKERTKQKIWMIVGFIFIASAIFGIFWYLSKWSVKQLVKGLSQPISEIGKSTQEFANSALNLAADMNQTPSAAGVSADALLEEDQLSHGSNLLEIRKSALELIERNKDMFQNPDSKFIEFLEQQGRENPYQMGAILAELDPLSVKTLYKYGWGEWWFTALASPAPLTPKAIKILSEIDRLRVRWSFSEEKSSPQFKEAGLAFTRLSDEQLVTILQGSSLQDAEPVLDLLPRAQALSVAKKIFPGQWAQLLENHKSLSEVKPDLINKFKAKALELSPLRKEAQIQSFFADLDLVKFLDVTTPRDERDFYLVLPPDSKIKNERIPFFKVLEAPLEVKKMMGPEINAKDWAIVLAGCESLDQKNMLDGFSDRLQFLVKEEIAKVNPNLIDQTKVRNIRKAILQSYIRNSSKDAYTSGKQNENIKAA